MEHTTIAVDLAKSVFQVAVSHRPGQALRSNRQPWCCWRRAAVLIAGPVSSSSVATPSDCCRPTVSFPVR